MNLEGRNEIITQKSRVNNVLKPIFCIDTLMPTIKSKQRFASERYLEKNLSFNAKDLVSLFSNGSVMCSFQFRWRDSVTGCEHLFSGYANCVSF